MTNPDSASQAIFGSGKCKCPLCNHSRMIKRVIRRGDVKELRKWLRGTCESYFDAAVELEMANSYISELRTASKSK